MFSIIALAVDSLFITGLANNQIYLRTGEKLI